MISCQHSQQRTIYDRNAFDFTVKNFFDYFKGLSLAIKKIYGPEALRSWAINSGITSRISFQKYIKGARPVPDSVKARMSQNLDLSSAERERLLDFGSHEDFSNTVGAQHLVKEDFFNNPINTLILNLCGIEAEMDELKIYTIFYGVYTKDDIDTSIQVLMESHLVKRTANGVLTRCFEGSVTTLPGKKSFHSKEYFKFSYRLVELAWEQTLVNRELNAFTFRMRHEDVPKVKTLVRNFRSQLSQFHSSNLKSDSVYHCSIVVFPVFTPETKFRLKQKSEGLSR